MKQIYVLALCFITMFAKSQTPTLRIHQNDGTVLKIPVANIDSLIHVNENAGAFASITTASPTGVTNTSVVSGGNIISNGGSPVVLRGICWDTLPDPTPAKNKLEGGSGTGLFTSNISNLRSNKTYYLRAYAINALGTAYGNQVSFTTFGVTPPSTNELWMIGPATQAGWTNPLQEPLRTNLKFTRVSPTQYEIITDLSSSNSFIVIPQMGSWDYFSFGRRLASLPYLDSGFFAKRGSPSGFYFSSCSAKGIYKFSLDFQTGRYKLLHTQPDMISQFVFPDNQITRNYTIAPGSTYYLPVSFLEVSEKPRTIKFIYSSSQAIRDVNYASPDSIIIPAGKLLDSIPFKGSYDSYVAERKDTVQVKIASEFSVNLKDSIRLVLQKYCDVVLSQLSGEFPNTREFRPNGAFAYGPYTTFVDNLISTGITSAEGVFVNLYDEGWNDIKFTMDWSDPANFKIAVPRQATGKTGSSDVQFVRSSTDRVNTFSSCSNTFTISLDLLGGNNDNVLSAGYRFVLAK